MLTLLLREPRSIVPSDRAEPRPLEDEALVRIRSVGICGSDLHAFRGHHPYVTYPRVLGHELGGEIIDIGPNDRRLRPGDRVCVEPILSCGRCYPCRQGRYNCCTVIRVLGIHTDGGMVERISVPTGRLHKPPLDLSFDELALCETLSIGVQAIGRSGLVGGETALILGAGPIGLGALVAARAKGARTLISDPHEANREVAVRMGADVVLDPSDANYPSRVRDEGGGDGGPHVVLEAVGSPGTIVQAVDLVAPTGRVVIIGICKGEVPLPISEIMRKEIDVRTTRNSCGAFPDVLTLFQGYRESLARMITHRFAFEDGPKVFSWLDDQRGKAGVVKAVLRLQ